MARYNRFFLCFLLVGFLTATSPIWADDAADKPQDEPAAQSEEQATEEDEDAPADVAETPSDDGPEKTADNAETASPNDKVLPDGEAKDAEPDPKESKPVSEEKAKDEKKKEKRATCTAERKPIKVTISLDGVFAAEKMREISVNPDEWNSLTVKKAVSHGAEVRKGDVILSLDTEKLDRAIDDLRTDLKIAEISINQSEDQLLALEKMVPLDLEASERSARMSGEDKKYFEDVDRPFAEKLANFRLKLAEESLEYEQEELRQLEKMYKADEITEETEQIVLKRARDTVEKAKFMVDYVQLEREQMLKFALPRYAEAIDDSAQRTAIGLERAKIQLPLTLKKQQLELEKQRMAREKSKEKLKNLLADRKMMTVKSPIDGIVYYGKCIRGKFSDSNSLAENLRRDGAIMPNQVVMTVVDQRPMQIAAVVPELQLHWVRPGLKGVAKPTGFPDLKLDAEIDDVGDIPTAPGSFDATLAVQLKRKAKWIMPGMTCKVKLIPYEKKDALVVDPKCIQTDELDEDQKYVWLLGKDEKPERRDVEVGEKAGKRIEILSGLTDGDQVLLEAPKDQESGAKEE